MCCIIGGLGRTANEAVLAKALDSTVSRGPDMMRTCSFPGGALGFRRLSIMGLDERGMQPFHLE